ncbi:MAG: response regulator [Ignavibacteria bacterium]|nr:response regulator [Ignavibacteria bacterium]
MAHESILIVEDEPLAARFVQILLERLHYAVCGTAATGQDAIAMVKAEKPDLVLMDIALKGAIDGIETTRELRKFHDIPVVFLTAFSDLETLERAKQTEPYGFLVKPFKAEDLASVVRVALTKHAMDRQLRQSHKRYMTLVQNISDGVLLYRANGSLQLCNKQASELTGIGERQLFTENCVELDWNAVDERGRPLESRDLPFVQAVLRGTAVRHAVLGFPRQGSADRTWVIVNVEPTRSSSTGELEFLATITDITTLAGAEKALVDTRAQRHHRLQFSERRHRTVRPGPALSAH